MNQEMITTALAQYNITDAAIAKYKSDYMGLIVKNVRDEEGYKLVHSARMVIKGKRIEVEKKRKELKEDALRYGQAVDKEAKRITALLEPIEGHLESQEKIIDDEKARIKAEAEAKELARIQARIDKIFSFGCSFNGNNYILPFAPTGYNVPQSIVRVCTDDQFEQICNEFQKLVDAEQLKIANEKAAKAEEEKRLAKIKAEQEAEAKRLEAIAREQAERESKIKAEQEKKEAEIRAAQEAIAREQKRLADAQALEIAKKEAAEKAKIEAEAKVKREAEEKAERERLARIEVERQAALKPDKEKLITFADSLEVIICPELKNESAKIILSAAQKSLAQIADKIRKEARLL